MVSVSAHLRALRAEWEHVEPPRRPVLLINPRSGGGKAARAALADRARERGVEPVVLGPGDDLATLVATAVDKGADALGMAGTSRPARSPTTQWTFLRLLARRACPERYSVRALGTERAPRRRLAAHPLPVSPPIGQGAADLPPSSARRAPAFEIRRARSRDGSSRAAPSLRLEPRWWWTGAEIRQPARPPRTAHRAARVRARSARREVETPRREPRSGGRRRRQFGHLLPNQTHLLAVALVCCQP